jgi:Spy/CpxP family protein refolding chaperone
MKKIILFTTLLLLAVTLSARGQMQNDAEHRAGYYQYMVFRLTEDLALTEEQAEQFFPLHRSYQDQKRQNHHQIASLSREAYEQKNVEKADLDKYQKELQRLKTEEIELDAAFYADLEKFLDPDQVLRFMFFDHHFRNELSRELKERYHKPDQDNKRRINRK